MEIPTHPAIGAITAALIGGAISFITTLLSKDQKTSEYRQNWIDSLRKDISEYVALFVTFIAYQNKAFEASEIKGEKYVLSQQKNWCKLTTLDAAINLRLNPKDDKDLIELIDAATNMAAETKAIPVDLELVNQLALDIIEQSQTLLKAEWRRVKRGEWTFFITKWGGLVIAAAALAALIMLGLADPKREESNTSYSMSNICLSTNWINQQHGTKLPQVIPYGCCSTIYLRRCD
jgi:hypothetical protein